MEALGLVQKMYLELFGKKNLELFDVIFHPALRFHLFEDGTVNFFEYKSLCEKVFAEPVEIRSKFREGTFIENGARFSGQVEVTLDHRINGKNQFLVLFNGEVKGGKILEFSVDSQFEWTTINYLMGHIADVLNDFKILPNSFSKNL